MEKRYKISPKQFEYLKKAHDALTKAQTAFVEKQEYVTDISNLVFDAAGVPEKYMTGARLDDKTLEIVVNTPDEKPEDTT